MQLIDGKIIAQEIQEEIKGELLHCTGRKPCLAVIIVGENPASKIYVGRKVKACQQVGFRSILREMPGTMSEKALLQEIDALNHDEEVDGILVQLPLPEAIDPVRITLAIDPAKDVDGLHPLNLGKLMLGEKDGFIPCTPLGILELLRRSHIELTGKNVVILGRSNIVGKPLASLLSQKENNATVTVLHSKSNQHKQFCLAADIIIAAMGKPKWLKADMVKPGAVIIDVGMNQILEPKKHVVGDVAFDEVKGKCSAITPVPGGVGPMTIAMLMQNTFKSYKNRIS